MIADAVEAFGLGAVVLMVASYTLEVRHRHFTLVFAFACAGAAIYALLIRSYPFMIAEAIWSMIAAWKWQGLRSDGKKEKGDRAGRPLHAVRSKP